MTSRIAAAVYLALLVSLNLSIPAAAFAPAPSPRYDVAATAIDLRIQDQPSREYPSVGHLAETPYDQAIKIWADRRFNLTGASVNTLRITLSEGRIVEKVLPIKKGIGGWFKKEPATEYSASLAIAVAIVDATGAVLASTDAKSWHSTALIEGATSGEKNQALARLVDETFAALDREIGPQFERHMPSYVQSPR